MTTQQIYDKIANEYEIVIGDASLLTISALPLANYNAYVKCNDTECPACKVDEECDILAQTPLTIEDLQRLQFINKGQKC